MPADILVSGSAVEFVDVQQIRLDSGATVSFLNSKLACGELIADATELREDSHLTLHGGNIVMRKRPVGTGQPGDVTITIHGDEGDIDLAGIGSLLSKLADLEQRIAQLEA